MLRMRRSHWRGLLSAALVAAAFAVAAPAAQQAERKQLEAVTKWLAVHAIPLATAEAGHGFEDMQPLKAVVGDARVVALGEATHGTREFFQLKHRMLEFLVEEMGFSVFAIEATMPEAFDVNHYVLTGEGDAEKALAGLYFWTWNTEEVLELIRWMRRYNADPAHQRKVKFYGFDLQSPPRAARVALEYLEKVDPEEAATAREVVGKLANPFLVDSLYLASDEEKQRISAGVHRLLQAFDTGKAEYVSRSSRQEWAVARQHARLLAQGTEMTLSPFSGASSRDLFMAANVEWILEHEGPETKIVLWAHNGHVSAVDWGDWTPMGAHLRKAFGGDMVVMGFAFNRGSFQALGGAGKERGLQPFTVAPAPAGSLDATLAAAGLEIAAVDLRRLPEEGPVAEWFAAPHKSRNLGAVYSERWADRYWSERTAPESYDVLLFVEETSAARANAAGRRPLAGHVAAPTNLGFEAGAAGEAPPGWRVPSFQNPLGFTVARSRESPYEGEACAVIERPPGHHYGEAFGALGQTLEAEPYRGKRVRLKAAVRVEGAGEGGRAYLWLRGTKEGYGPASTAFLENMADRPITTPGWQIYELTGDLPEDGKSLDYGLAFVGEGKAWLDAISLEVEGVESADSEAADGAGH